MEYSLHRGVNGWRVGSTKLEIIRRNDRRHQWTLARNSSWVHTHFPNAAFDSRRDAFRAVVAMLSIHPLTEDDTGWTPAALLKVDEDWVSADQRFRITMKHDACGKYFMVYEKIKRQGSIQVRKYVYPSLREAACAITMWPVQNELS